MGGVDYGYGPAVYFENGTSITSVYGDITIYGKSGDNQSTGAAKGFVVRDYYLNNGLSISSTGTGPNAANISLISNASFYTTYVS